MIRLLARIVINLIANALGLMVAAALLDGFNINLTSIIYITILFTIINTVLGPLIMKITLTNLPALMGGIALVTTFVGLLLTDIVLEGLNISGLKTWLLSVVIIWAFSLIAGLLLPLVIFKKTLKKD